MDFNNASLAELRQYVKANGIKGTSAMKKKELAEYLIEREQNNGDIKSATSEETNNNQKKKVEKIRKKKIRLRKIWRYQKRQKRKILLAAMLTRASGPEVNRM